jgi:hypothetical protein
LKFDIVLEYIDEDATSWGTAVPYKYMNYAYSFQDPIASYDKENQGFMQGVSQRCDSDQLFQKAYRGGLKLENTLDSGI